MNWPMISALSAASGVIVSLVGFLLIVQQIRENRKVVRARFITELETDFRSHRETYGRLDAGGVWASSQSGPTTHDEKVELTGYLNFFEKLFFLLQSQTLDLPTLDVLYSYRFFVAANNKHAQNQILYASEYDSHFQTIFALHDEWTKYRVAHRLNIPGSDRPLDRSRIRQRGIELAKPVPPDRLDGHLPTARSKSEAPKGGT